MAGEQEKIRSWNPSNPHGSIPSGDESSKPTDEPSKEASLPEKHDQAVVKEQQPVPLNVTAVKDTEPEKPKYHRSFVLTNENLMDVPLPHIAQHARAELEAGDHIKTARQIGFRFDHHAIVSTKPTVLTDGSLRVDVIEFSVAGKSKFIGVIRERTLFLTNDSMKTLNIRRVDGHYNKEPPEKWNKDKRKLVKTAGERVKCRCNKCTCNIGDLCNCGKPEQKCQDKDAHREKYSVASKNCEHFVLSLFGENRSFQVEESGLSCTSFCCTIRSQIQQFPEEQFESTGSEAPEADERQETQEA